MAAYVSSQTGNWNQTATWGDSGPPTDGDTVTISNDHVVTVTADVTVGATTGTAHGILISGSSSSSYGKLIVNDGITLTLKGVDRESYFAMYIQRYGQFAPAAGAIIIVSCTSDYQTGIKNDGIISAIGTLAKPITFSVPFRGDWTGHTTDVASENKSGSGDTYSGNIRVRGLDRAWITNSGKTALGSSASTSFAISASTPAGLCTTPVASIAAVDSAGDYYLDHDAGIIYFYSTEGLTSITYSYTHLKQVTADWRGWGIWTGNNNTYCKALFEYCVFEHMGSLNQYYSIMYEKYTDGAVGMANRKTVSVEADRLMYVKNCTFRYNCGSHLYINTCTGAAADKFLLTDNTFSTYQVGGRQQRTVTILASSYFTISGSILNQKKDPCFYLELASHVSITGSTGYLGETFVECPSSTEFGYGKTPDNATRQSVSSCGSLYIADNDLTGREGAVDGRVFKGVGGTSALPAIVEDNHIRHGFRLGHQGGSYVTFRRNIFDGFIHHGMTASEVDDIYVTDVVWENNLFRGETSLDSDAFIQLGYNHRTTINNLIVRNNTLCGGKALLDIGDVADTAAVSSLSSNISVVNNIIYGTDYGIVRDPGSYTKIHILEFDYNAVHDLITAYGLGLTNNANATNFWISTNKYNRIGAGSRNVPFVALFDGSYATNQSTGRSLVHTVNTAGQDQTLAWGGGSAVQLISDYGTSSGISKRTLTCSGKSWTLNGVRAKWLWIYGGTGAGQIRSIVNYGDYGLYSISVVSGGTDYSVGQFIILSDGTCQYEAVLKVESVSSGVITAVSIHSGGLYSVTPSDAVSSQRITGDSGSGATFNCLWGPTLMVSPDFTTAIDATSTFAIVNSEVQLTDSGADTVQAGICGSLLSTTGGTDSGITVTVDKTLTGDPLFVGSSFPSDTIADYKIQSGSPAKDAGTPDDAADADYWETSRPQGSADDIGFYEYTSGTQNYTRGDYDSLPGDDTDLETNYSSSDYADVASNNEVRVAMAAAQAYAIHQFKDFVGSATYTSVEWEGRSSLAPSASTVYLQIYNHTHLTWDTIDYDDASNADEDFTLTAFVADLTEYVQDSMISCRVYQQNP